MREQIITQISLGITSGDLKAGEKLPSTRELARRFQVHQNTISAAYRQLAERDLVEFKKGSGVYVSQNNGESSTVAALEQLINKFYREAFAEGFTAAEIKTALQKRLSAKPPTQFFIIESDAELRKILIKEVADAVDRDVLGISFEELPDAAANVSEKIWLMFDKAENTQRELPPKIDCIYLKANSVPDSMTGKERPSNDDLIAIVSGWEKFLSLAKMFLLAARIAPETLLARSTNQTNWQSGLPAVSLIICDSATAEEFPDDERVRVFRLIADSSLEKLRGFVEQN